MQKITPFLWFDNEAEQAARFYVSIFKSSKIKNITRYGKEGYKIHKQKAGMVIVVEFQLAGQKFLALNGGPIFKFSESISFVVHCKTQKEVDYYWEKLSSDPKSEQCRWLKDKYGLSWQIVPTILGKLLGDKDPQAGRVMEAMLKMKKIDIEGLKKAYEG